MIDCCLPTTNWEEFLIQTVTFFDLLYYRAGILALDNMIHENCYRIMTLDTTPPLFRVLPELEKVEGMLEGTCADFSEWCDVSADNRMDD